MDGKKPNKKIVDAKRRRADDGRQRRFTLPEQALA
jgi:hypothetical protein